MGTTYSNCQVRSESQETVVEALTRLLKEPAYVAPVVNGWVGVYHESDGMAQDRLAKRLSARLSCAVFFWSVYDSDIFSYNLYENGKKRDEFESEPDYFEEVSKAKKARLSGKPEALVPYCLPGVAYAQVQQVLHPPLLKEGGSNLPIEAPLLSEKSLQLFSRTLKTTPGEIRAGFEEKRRERYTFAEEQAADLAKLLGIAEELESCEHRDVAEASGHYAARPFRLVGNEDLSQEYKNRKLWSSFQLESLESAVKAGAEVNARDGQGVPLVVRVARYCLNDAVSFLVSMGADVNAATFNPRPDPDLSYYLQMGIGNEWEDGVTALMVAAGASVERPVGLIETMQALLDAGADVNARNATGRTALGEALKMTDHTQHQGRIGRRAPEEVLRQAAARSAQVVEMLRAAGATE